MHRRLLEATRVDLAERIKPLAEKYGTMPLDMVLKDLHRNGVKADRPTPMPSSYKSLDYKNGTVDIPTDWIYAKSDLPEESDYACAVSVKEVGEALHMPIFVTFLKKHPDQLSDDEYHQIEENCKAVYPKFKKAINREIYYAADSTYRDNDGYIKTQEEFAKAPKIGIFLIDSEVKSEGLTYGCKIHYKDEATIKHMKEIT